MSSKVFLMVVILTVQIIISIVYNTYIFARARKSGTLIFYLCVQIFMTVWLSGKLFEVISPTPEITWRMVLFQHLGIVPLPLFWFFLGFTYKNEKLPGSLFIGLNLVLALILIVLIFYKNKYAGFEINTYFLLYIYALFYLIIGNVMFFNTEIRKPNSQNMTQKIYIIIFTGIILIFEVIRLNYSFIPLGDIKPILYFILITIFTCLFWNELFLDMSPINLNNSIDTIKDAVLIIDSDNYIVDANYSILSDMFKSGREIKDLNDFVLNIKDCLAEDPLNLIDLLGKKNKDRIHGEVALNINSAIMHFVIYFSPLFDKRENKIGGIITFHDITYEKGLMSEIDKKNTELKEINEKLQDYVSIASKLEEEKELTRIAHEFHTSIGQKMVELLMMLEVLHISIDNDKISAKANLNKAIENCRSLLQEIRSIVSKLMPLRK